MTRNKLKYFDNPAWDTAFERCVDVLAELIEKYGDRVLSAIDDCYVIKVAVEYSFFSKDEFIIYEVGKGVDYKVLKAYGEISLRKSSFQRVA